MSKEYFIYCDESSDKGKLYGSFYGGLLIPAEKVQKIEKALRDTAINQGFNSELKWQKVTLNYLEKYKNFINEVFKFISNGDIKIRIMFSKNGDIMHHADNYQREHKYFLLYYQFIKHAFGLTKIDNPTKRPIKIRVYLDQLPDTKEKAQRFKGYIHALEKQPNFKAIPLKFPEDQIAEIDSKEHILLQSIDLILGAMYFYLNGLYEEIPDGQAKLGKRTLAKKALFDAIYENIKKIEPNFDIAKSTKGYDISIFTQPYRHWLFIPKQKK